MRRPLVTGNWKMNGSCESIAKLLDQLKAGAEKMAAVDIAVCPPFIYLQQVSQALQGTSLAWGAQNLSEQESGAYTGEVSGAMIADLKCHYVIVGHSERRTLYAETDELVARKFAAAQKHKLIPILCIGETLEERDRGVTEAVVARQLDAVLATQGAAALENAVLAYEPVWAIGSGRTATPAQAAEVHRFIRAKIAQQNTELAARIRILYGGSVKGSNAADLFRLADIDGGLIGGASLNASEFLSICAAATG